MKLVLEIPDNKVSFILELLENMPFIKAKPMKEKVIKDTTQYLMSSQTNYERLSEAIERANRGEVEIHQLIEE